MNDEDLLLVGQYFYRVKVIKLSSITVDIMLKIRKASLGDYQIILKILKESVKEEDASYYVPPGGISATFHERIMEDLKRLDHGVLIAEEGGTAVGFAYYHQEPDFYDIEEMDVKKDCQSQGIGRALLDYIEKIAKEKGINRLQTGTAIDLEGKRWVAYGFWIHMGFTETGEIIKETQRLRFVKLIKELSS